MNEPNIYDAGQDHTKRPEEYSKPDAGTPTPRTKAAISNGWIKEGSSAAAKFTEMERDLAALRTAHEAAQARVDFLHHKAECLNMERQAQEKLIAAAQAEIVALREKLASRRNRSILDDSL